MALEPGGNAGDEEGRGPGELRGRTSLDHLVQCTKRQPALRKPLIDGRETKGERPVVVPAALQTHDLVPQIGKLCPLPGTHAPCPTYLSLRHVLIMFSADAESI
jgi:hypothetical protein